MEQQSSPLVCPAHTAQYIGALVLSILFSTSIAYAWTAPTATPPGGNADAPINTGTINQEKTGGLLSVFNLWINSALGVTGGATFGGNVGIGTTAPHYLLDFGQAPGTRKVIALHSNTTGADFYGLGTDAAGLMTFWTNNIQQMVINPNGNVGIGTTDFTGIIGSGNLKVAGKIYGDGSKLTGVTADLTNLNANNLTSGTVPSARVSGSYLGITGVGTITSGTWNGTSIADANISSAATWNAKAPTASPTFTGTVSGITKAMVGLTNVDNTSDANKPVSLAQQTALNLKANIASPTFTGTVTAPTINANTITLGGATLTWRAYSTDGSEDTYSAPVLASPPPWPPTDTCTGDIVGKYTCGTSTENSCVDITTSNYISYYKSNVVCKVVYFLSK